MATTDNRLPTEGTQIDIEARLAAIETALASLMVDTTGQSIASAISGLGQTLGSDKANISGDNIVDKATFRNAIDAAGKFQYFRDVAGGVEIDLPAEWNTLIVQSVYRGNGTFMNSIFLSSMMTSNLANVSLGNYGTSYSIGRISKTKFILSTFNWGGSDVTSNSKAYLYYC